MREAPILWVGGGTEKKDKKIAEAPITNNEIRGLVLEERLYGASLDRNEE